MMPSWSSDNSISASETSMPRLSTPRMVPTPSVIFLPGMYVPGGENTPFIPVRAFGAPHTTCTGSPSPVSTRHTRSRSALGCCSARTTDATRYGANNAALSSMASTSSPMRVSVVAISSTDAVVSRWSFSQERGNFMRGLRRRDRWSEGGRSPRGHGRACPAHPRLAASQRSEDVDARPEAGHDGGGWTYQASRRQPADQGRDVQWTEAVVVEPAHVRFEERAQVRHAVFQHGDAVDPHAPGKSLELVRVEAAVSQHVRVDHAAAEDLEPVGALAEADLATFAGALDVDLRGRFREREV